MIPVVNPLLKQSILVFKFDVSSLSSYTS